MTAPAQRLIEELNRVRDAIAADDWELAQKLLDDHDAQLHQILQGPFDNTGLDELLDAQRILMSELASAREEIGTRLNALRHGSHAVNAYRNDTTE